jgi:hypothetical protein
LCGQTAKIPITINSQIIIKISINRMMAAEESPVDRQIQELIMIKLGL